jgi:hypothetical protein
MLRQCRAQTKRAAGDKRGVWTALSIDADPGDFSLGKKARREVTMNLRRDIAEHVIARWKTRGIPIDEDPNFMDLVELWTTGPIGSDECVAGMRGSSASGPCAGRAYLA